MPTADMHGGTVEASEEGIKFTDNKGNPVAFETCRLGTLKELETMRGAYENASACVELHLASLETTQAKLAAMTEKRDVAEAAYLSLKTETQALLTNADKNCKELRATVAAKDGELETAGEAYKAVEDANANLVAAYEAEESVSAQLRAELAESADTHTKLCELVSDKNAEIEDLLSVKAQLEETSTALEVSQKELCEAREALADATKANEGHRDAYSVLQDTHARCETSLITSDRQRDASRQALADLKAELLTEGDRFKTILDTIAEKISGE